MRIGDAIIQTATKVTKQWTTAKESQAEFWAEQICAQIGKSVEAIVDIGRLLIQAKQRCGHGEWGRMFGEHLVPFGQETARRLMLIAKHPVLSNSTHGWNLPTSWRTLYELTTMSDDQLLQALTDGVITPETERKHVLKLLRHIRSETPAGPIPPLVTDRYELLESDVATLATHLDADSVDCIITDPPYAKEYIPLYHELAVLGAHVLKPGGSCLVMVGQTYLPEFLAALSSALTYHWTLAYLMVGDSSQIFQRHVKSRWKPVLWFVKGTYAGEHVDDIVRSPEPSKTFHDWGQSEIGMAELILKFSYKGQTILDPFVGGGTTLVAAVQLERLAIGADVDPIHLQTSAQRLQNLVQTV